MIKDKILIFFPYAVNVNAGGPSGFIAHNLLDKPRHDFLLAYDLLNYNKFTTILKRRISDKFFKRNFTQFLFDQVKAKDYKYIYFHDCETFEHCRELISYKQVVIIQSHSPELPSEEAIANGVDKHYSMFLEKAEKNAFQRADIIVFPNEECVQLYSSLTFDENKIKYILSGAQSQKDLRAYPLDNSKINLLYIGRRNNIKGFDRVMEAFQQASSIRNDINLILIGAGSKVEGKNIYDIGFSNTPQNWYNSVDYVINANRKSYFDLSVIEALSANAKIILDANFGHKFYLNKSSDILTFDPNNRNSLRDILLSEIKNSVNNNFNRQLFLKELSDVKYFERFLSFKNTIT